MFYKYEVRSEQGEDVLYLYLTMRYEFGEDFSLNNEPDLKRRTKNFIVSNSIPFKGNKVYLVIDGKIVKSLNLSNTKKTFLPSEKYSFDHFVIHIELEDHSICEISLREYLLGVLLSKYQEEIPDEVYKAMGVLFTTYAYKCMDEEKVIHSNNPFAIYRPISYYKSNFVMIDSILDRLNLLLGDIEGLFLSYQNHYILPFIHYSNSGMTLSNDHYPYLSSVKSLWDMASPYYIEIHDISYDTFYQKLGISLNKDSHITIITENHIKKIVLDTKIYTMEEFQKLFELKSTDIYLIIHNHHIRIITRGWGHSYGLSIFGACEIARNGGYYYHILKYYFPKVKLLKYIKELS